MTLHKEKTLALINAGSFMYYCKVASSNASCLEAHGGFFRLLMKGIFDKKLIFLISNAH